MRAQHVEYHAPARFDDELEVFVRAQRLGTTSVTWAFDAYHVDTGEHLASATQVVVAIDLGERRSVPIPAHYRDGRRAASSRRWRREPVARRLPRRPGRDRAGHEPRGRLGRDRAPGGRGAPRPAGHVLVGGHLLRRGRELALGPWKGPHATDHVRIPIGEGVCGAAASSGVTEIVDDVAADPRYLACFPSTRSEIVVPVIYEGTVVAEIDVDSDTPAAFGAADREFLERVATVISPHCLVGWDTGGMDWDAPENWR